MKNLIKLAAVGIGGYLIGYYEMKYKVVKLVAESYVEKEEKEKKEESAQ